MKNKLYILFVIVCLSGAAPIHAQSVPQGIISAFSSGDAGKLAAYFGQTIELTMFDEEQISSGVQAQVILKEFFTNNRPVSFEIIHQGGKESSKYAIGLLKTNGSEYRVTFLLKTVGNTIIIHQLRIQYEN